jgi:hypothetical protein
LDALSDALAVNKTIKELYLTNQRTTIPAKSGTPFAIPTHSFSLCLGVAHDRVL